MKRFAENPRSQFRIFDKNDVVPFSVISFILYQNVLSTSRLRKIFSENENQCITIFITKDIRLTTQEILRKEHDQRLYEIIFRKITFKQNESLPINESF